jgi:hypothetical protein
MAEVGAAAGAPASKGPDSAVGRIVGALFFPVRTFAAIAAKPTFLAPLVLWTGLSFLVSELVLTRTDWRAVIVASTAKRDVKLTEQQIDNAVETQKKFSWAYQVIAAAAPVAIAGVTAAVLWMACQAFGWELRFVQSFGVTTHAFLPGIFASIGLFAMLWGRTTIDPQSLDDVLPTNLGSLVSRTSNKALHSLLGSLDLLSFWTIALIVLGLSFATGARRGRMAVLVVSLWGLYVLGKAGLGILFP